MKKTMIDKPKNFLFYNFLSGTAKGIGFAFGATIVFALIIWILSKLSVIPFLGDWITALLDYVQQTKVY